MRLAPGGPQTVAQESITGRMLIDFGVNEPDFMPTVFRLFQDDESTITSILDIKGLKTQNINYSTNDGSYRTVGSNHVQFAIDNSDVRKIHLRANALGLTYKDDANATEIGRNQTPFYIWVDTNWAGYKEIIELADNRTLLYILQDPEEDSNDTWKLKVKVWTNIIANHVDVTLLEEGREAAAVMTAHEHEFSERGVEKYTFAGFGNSYLTLQRFKYSYSGTAKAMQKNGKVTGRWAVHNGQKLFIEEAQIKMMKRAAEYLEYQVIFGKSTVTTDTNKVILRDDNGREVMAGSGIMYSGDGPIDMPYKGWTKGFINSMLTNIDSYITRGSDGNREFVVVTSPTSTRDFHRCLREDFGLTMNNNIVGDGASKGIIDSYSFYEIDGLRLIIKRSPWFTQQRRPGMPLSDGTYTNEWDGLVVPLGLSIGGNRNGIELIQLRPASRGTVAGIDAGGNIASSVDGSQEHILFQNGVISVIQPIRLYRPTYM